MLLDEVRQLLRELIQETGALSVAVVHAPVEPDDPLILLEPLGSSAFLQIQLPTPETQCEPSPSRRLHLSEENASSPDESVSTDPARDVMIAGTIARAVRALRASTRRWDRPRVPECVVNRSHEPAGSRVRERIRAYLEALQNAHGADLVLVSLRREIVAASRPPDEMSRERIPFIVRRVDVEAQRQGNSHAELTNGDFYARSFWFSACLVMFFSAPYSKDFVRHRVRLVTRELVPLLSMLDEPPPVGVQTAPIPD